MDDRFTDEELRELERRTIGLATKLELLLLKRYGLHKEVAEDIVSDTVFKVIEGVRDEHRKERVRGAVQAMRGGRLDAYLVATAVNRMRDEIRHSQSVARAHALIRVEVPASRPTEPSNSLEGARLRSAIESLRSPYRQILELKALGWPLVEVARNLDIPLGSIYQMFRRARNRLKQVLEKEGET